MGIRFRLSTPQGRPSVKLGNDHSRVLRHARTPFFIRKSRIKNTRATSNPNHAARRPLIDRVHATWTHAILDRVHGCRQPRVFTFPSCSPLVNKPGVANTTAASAPGGNADRKTAAGVILRSGYFLKYHSQIGNHHSHFGSDPARFRTSPPKQIGRRSTYAINRPQRTHHFTYGQPLYSQVPKNLIIGFVLNSL